MHEVLATPGDLGLVPVVAIERAEDAVELGRALLAGGLPCAEITFRTAAAEQAIRNIASSLPEITLGAGTVLTADQAARAVSAGARFIVSPGFNQKVVGWCLDEGVPVTPGVATPTEIEMALERGLEILKFFSRRGHGWHRGAEGHCSSLRWCEVHPDGGREPGQSRWLPGPSQRPLLWRQLAGEGRSDLRWQVRRDHTPNAGGHVHSAKSPGITRFCRHWRLPTIRAGGEAHVCIRGPRPLHISHSYTQLG